MTVRKALTISGPAEEAALLNDVLPRFGFEAIETVATFEEMIKHLQHHTYHLVVVPVEHVTDLELAQLGRELRRNTSTSAIATAPKADSALILNVLRTGIHEFLVRPITSEDLVPVLERLLVRSSTTTSRGRVVAVYGSNGGVGVTTLAISLAFQFAKMHIGAQGSRPRIALVDLVSGRGDVRVLLNLTPRYDIHDLIVRQDRVDADVLYSLLTECPGGVWVLPATEDPQAASSLNATSTAAILSQLRANFDVTVLDCERHLSEHTITALDAADQIVLVTQLTLPMLRSTQRALQLFSRLGYPESKIAVVVNRFRSADVVSAEEASSLFEQNICCMVPNDFRTCAKAVARGVSVIAQDPDSSLSRAIAEVATLLAERTSSPGQPAPKVHRHHRSGIARLLKKMR